MQNSYLQNLQEAFNCLYRQNWYWHCNPDVYRYEAETNRDAFVSIIRKFPEEQRKFFRELWLHYKNFHSTFSHTQEEVLAFVQISERLKDHIIDYTEY